VINQKRGEANKTSGTWLDPADVPYFSILVSRHLGFTKIHFFSSEGKRFSKIQKEIVDTGHGKQL
jgi:hypothetical protein